MVTCPGAGNAREALAGTSLHGAALAALRGAAGRAVKKRTTSASSPRDPLLRTLGFRSLVVLPLRLGKEVGGAVAFAGKTRAVVRGARLKRIVARAGALLDARAERARHADAARQHRAVLDGVLEAVFLVDPSDGRIADVNVQAVRLTGHSREELRTMTIDDLHTAAEASKHRAEIARVAGAFRRYGPIDFLRKEGKPVAAEINARTVTAGEKKLVLCIVRDVSEQKRTEVKLAASEELLRIIVEGTLDVFFYVHDTAGAFTYVSPSVEKITGFPPEHWKTRAKDALTGGPANDAVREHTARALSEGISPPAYVCTIRHADGRPLLLEINEKPIFKEGKVIGIQGVARDITERKRLEEAILESRDTLTRILDQTPLAVTVLDARGNLTDVNGAWLRLFGAAHRDEVVGHLNVFHSPFFRALGLAAELDTVYRGGVVDVPALTIDPARAKEELPLEGQEVTVHARMFPVFERNGRLVNVVAMMEDVTERRRLEEQLIQSQKMESIGLLAGGIAHDFNNILGGILGYASFVKAQVQKGDRIYPHLETIERSALRAADLTSQLLGFARGGKYVVGPIQVNDLVRETSELLRGTIEKNITVETIPDTANPVIEADASQIQQVLMNLCVNARDAMPGGGTLTIVTERLRAPDAFLRSVLDGRQGDYVRIDVADTGVGIDRAIRNRIFDPFFTTKEKGQGTGLGLATVYGIVKNHNGFINVESDIGAGTTFSVYIPAVDRPVPRAEGPEARVAGGRETIMVVDDEETIRFLVRDILQQMGYTVLGAAEGEAAVELYTRNRGRIDLVILDMTMPGMGGRETFEKLKEIDPGVRAILSTGYAEDERARQMLALGVRAFVQKPYRVDELASAVRRILDAPPH